MSDQQTPTTQGAGLTQSLLPHWDTDHGDFNFGDLLILLFDAILLVYTGWRSFDLLSGTVPSGWEIMAFIGLLALDIGAVIWSYIWMFNSTTKWQDRIAMIFFVIDMSGVALTSITDSLLYGDTDSVMLAMLEPITMVVIPLVIISNVIAGIVYHFTSDRTRTRRTKRQLEAKARAEAQRQEDEELQLHYAQQSLLRRQAELPRKIALANLKIAQDQLEKQAMQALFGTGDVARGTSGINTGIDVSSVNIAEFEEQMKTLQALQDPAVIRENSDADPAAIEEALRGYTELGNRAATASSVQIPKQKTKGVPQWIFFRTNSKKHLIRTNQDGTNVAIINGVPSMLKFSSKPPFHYMAGRPENAQPQSIVKNALIPRFDRDGKLISPFYFMKGNEKEPLEIIDWKNTAICPVGTDIWGATAIDTDLRERQKSGEDGEVVSNPTQAGA